MAIQGILPGLRTMPVPQSARTSPLIGLSQLITSNFSLSTLITVGACIQVLASLVLRNSVYAMLPAIILLSIRIAEASMIHFKIRPNPYTKDVLFKKSTAIIPDQEGTLFIPGKEKVAILLLGAKSNHPFGFFAPEFLKTGAWIQKMNKSFNEDRPSGFLGQTNWNRRDERGAIEFTFISYWRSIEDLHAFAHAPLHRQAWIWWEKTLMQHDAIGINHEIYEADAGHWENVYINFQPTGLGATTYVRKSDGTMEGGQIGDEWISPLVNAGRGALRSSAGRLRRPAAKFDGDQPGTGVY